MKNKKKYKNQGNGIDWQKKKEKKITTQPGNNEKKQRNNEKKESGRERDRHGDRKRGRVGTESAVRAAAAARRLGR